MIKVETNVVINRPIGEVFAFVTNPANGSRYQSGVQESKQTSEGPIGVGTTYHEVRQFLGRRIVSDNEVTEYEPNRQWSFKSTSGPLPVEGSYTFESTEGGTSVTMSGQAEAGSFFKLADPIVNRMVRRQLEADSANLKDLLEAGV